MALPATVQNPNFNKLVKQQQTVVRTKNAVQNKVNASHAVMNVWTSSNTGTTNISNPYINQATTSSGTFISSNNIVTLSNNQSDWREFVLNWLISTGVPLEDGGTLRIDDGVPVVVYTHADGSRSKKPLPIQHRGVIDLGKHLPDIAPGTILRMPGGNCLEVSKDDDGTIIKEIFVNTRDKVIDVLNGNSTLYESLAFCHFREIQIPSGANTHATLRLPNGVEVHLFPDDHIEIDESNGKQLYKSHPIRDFNRYLNASDLLEEFIGYCATQKLTKKEFAELPVSLFIYWLIVQAAEADGDSTDDTLPLLTSAVKERKSHNHRCKCCGKFLTKKFLMHGVSFCSPQHMENYLSRI